MKRQLYHGITHFTNNNLYADLFVKIGDKFYAVARNFAGESRMPLSPYLTPPLPLNLDDEEDVEAFSYWLNVSKKVRRTLDMMSDDEAIKYLESDDFEVPRVQD